MRNDYDFYVNEKKFKNVTKNVIRIAKTISWVRVKVTLHKFQEKFLLHWEMAADLFQVAFYTNFDVKSRKGYSTSTSFTNFKSNSTQIMGKTSLHKSFYASS